jgi:hypothetical protein
MNQEPGATSPRLAAEGPTTGPGEPVLAATDSQDRVPATLDGAAPVAGGQDEQPGSETPALPDPALPDGASDIPAQPGEPPGDSAVTSAADIARLLRLISGDSRLSAASRAELFGWLATPSPLDPLRETLPAEVAILDKTGNLDNASNVGALLSSPRGTVILVVLNTNVAPGDARGVIARVGRATYDRLLH